MMKMMKGGSKGLAAVGRSRADVVHPHIVAEVDAAACLHHPVSLRAAVGAAEAALRAHTVKHALEDVMRNADTAATVMSSSSLGRRGPVLTVPVSRATPTALEAVGKSVAIADANVLGLHKWMAFVSVVASPF